MPAHLVEVLARRQQPVALGQLADDLIRRVTPALLVMVVAPLFRVAND